MASRYSEDVRLMKALADENRLAILELLMDGAKCGCVLLERLSIQQPTLSHHMKILCEAGIVDACREGKWMHYSICAEGSRKLRELLDRCTLSEEALRAYPKCKDCK